MPDPIIVMGPSGCGKSTLGRLLADALGLSFVEGDDLHPPANRRRMARGQALTDADRIPYLDAIAEALTDDPRSVASCSALKRAYRDRLRARLPGLLFVHPIVDRDELADRMSRRAGHFMPVSLLDDQLDALEPLAPDETGMTLDGSLQVSAQLGIVLKQLGRRS